jgi:hypothetical protein
MRRRWEKEGGRGGSHGGWVRYILSLYAFCFLVGMTFLASSDSGEERRWGVVNPHGGKTGFMMAMNEGGGGETVICTREYRIFF